MNIIQPRHIYLLITLVIVLWFAPSAKSDELVVNLASNHLNSAFNFNEVNPGLGIKMNNTEIGFFRNSYHNTNATDARGDGYSLYTKFTFREGMLNSRFGYSLDLGLAYYGDDGPYSLVPIVQPQLKFFLTKRNVLNLGYVPIFIDTWDGNEHSRMKGLLTLSYSYRW